MTDAGWIDRFIRHLEYERRLSPLTCKNYRRDLDSLAAWCEASGIGQWGDLDSEHVRAYSASCFRKGLSARSLQRRLSASRTFFRYLIREKEVSKNPVSSVSAPKGKKRLPGNLDADRMARLLDIQGVGALVDRGENADQLLEGLTYFEFLAPALLATTGMMISSPGSATASIAKTMASLPPVVTTISSSICN